MNNRLQGLAPTIIRERLDSMSTEEFVEWMNSEFLNRGDHGDYCKIYELYDDNYWSDYVRPMGADIAVGVAKGFKYGRFDYSEQYVLYIDFDDNFITFDTKEQFFDEVWPLDDIVAEMSYRD